MKRFFAMLLCMTLLLTGVAVAEGEFPELNEAGFFDGGEFVYTDPENGVWRYCSDTLKIEIYRRTQDSPKEIWYEAEVWSTEDNAFAMIPWNEDPDKRMSDLNYPYKIARANQTVLAINSDFAHLRISQNSRLGGDSAIALISSGALAAGVLVTSLTSGLNADVYSYMFGSILAMSEGDVYLSLALAAVVLVLFIVFYNRIFAITFDESFARATGTRVSRYNMLLALLTALTIVIGMRIMGTMLISGLIIFPALTAMRVCRSFRGVVVASAIVSVFCFFMGMTLSYALGTPAGASIVAVNALLFCVFALVGKLAKR